MWPIGVGMWRQWCIGIMTRYIPPGSKLTPGPVSKVKEEEEKKKEKDNQYKLRKAMATPLA